jgi:hypothetical protein
MRDTTHVVVKHANNPYGCQRVASFNCWSSANRFAANTRDLHGLCVMGLLDFDELHGRTGSRHYYASRYSWRQLRAFAAAIENEVARVQLSREDLPYRDKEILAARAMIDVSSLTIKG